MLDPALEVDGGGDDSLLLLHCWGVAIVMRIPSCLVDDDGGVEEGAGLVEGAGAVGPGDDVTEEVDDGSAAETNGEVEG